MLVLGINTVADVCEAALLTEAGLVAQRTEPMTQGHDARLAPLVAALLEEAGVKPAQLDRIAVIAGPGSFTGVRVGVAFARGLALALAKPAAGITSLEALGGLPGRGRALGLLPAKRRPPERSWWAQVIVDGRGEGEPVEADAAMIARLGESASVLCGGLEGVPDAGLKRIEARPTAEAAARMILGLAEADLPAPRPIYVRAPDALPATGPVFRP